MAKFNIRRNTAYAYCALRITPYRFGSRPSFVSGAIILKLGLALPAFLLDGFMQMQHP